MSSPDVHHTSHASPDADHGHGKSHAHEGVKPKEVALLGLGAAGVVAAGMIVSLGKVVDAVSGFIEGDSHGGHGHDSHGHDLFDFAELFSAFVPDGGGGGGGGGKSHGGGHH